MTKIIKLSPQVALSVSGLQLAIDRLGEVGVDVEDCKIIVSRENYQLARHLQAELGLDKDITVEMVSTRSLDYWSVGSLECWVIGWFDE